MKRFLALVLALPLALHAHTLPPQDKEALRAHLLEEFMQKTGTKKVKPVEVPVPKTLKRPVTVAGLSAFDLSSFLTSGSALPPAGNGVLMAASFAPFKPKVRYNWDGTTFFLESDNTPEGMPNKMFGITTWQQQVPIPAAYFAHSTSNENNAGSLGYQQPNVWRIPLVPTVSASPITIYNPPAAPTNFLRGAVALASNGIAIFNPANNTGQVSYEIGELDYYGGHCGLADDYHYHIIPTHLNTRFGGPLGDDKPVAWALDGYPIYGFVEPDGSPRQPLDAEGGHDHGPWGYHYHAVGTTTVDATHPYGTPQSPYMMKAFHGTVVNFGNQVDGQPAVANLRANGTGGYNAKAVAGAYIVAQMNPAPLVVDGSGHLNLVAGVNLTGCATTYGSTTVTCASTTGLTTGLAVVGYGVSNGARVTSVTNATQFVLSIPAIATTTGKNFTAVSMATASPDAHVMRVNMGGVDYDECWTINRKVSPRSLTMTWRAQALVGGQLSGPVLTTTQTYTPAAGSASGNRLTAYPMGAWSEVKLPDTSQAISTTTTFGEDSDYTTTPSANPQSFTDNGDGTITDNVTGLMWQKADAGEMTWENAVNNAGAVTTGGYSDWRLPNPHELMSLFNYETGNPAMNATYFPPASPSAEYWWSRDVFGTSTTNVWCVNSGGGVGPKPKAETVSAGGTLRYHARYVRLAQNNMTHNYVNNLDCTITDTDTSLMWTQMPSTAMTWEAALAWAEGLTLGGYNDWRMPNIKELQTLTDYSLATTSGGTATNLKPAINRTMFAKTMSGCSVTSGSPVVATSDTTDLAVGMTVIDPFSIAGTYINHTTTPTITAINPGVSFTLSSNAIATGTGLIFRALPLATAYWSSTSLKGNTTEAWLLELGVNTAVTPPRGAQGIISYQAKTASFPVFAVRSVSAGSVTQGLATTTTSNLFPPGQRVSAVGTITATDNTTWTVPAATLYTSAEKAPDLYNEYNSVTPANLAAAQAAIAALPTKVIDADGEVVTGYIFADNYFELYVNGVLVGVDPVPFTAFNSCVVKFKAKRPITYAVRLVDWEENLGLGTELNGGDPHHIGDGGFIASFSDGTVTNSDWKAQTFYIAPLDDPNQVVELANGTRSSAGATHNLTTTAYAMHYPLPGGWYASGFSTAGWPAATTYTEAQVGVNFPAYMNFQPQFTGSGAQFIWSSSLTLDNEVVLRYTGPATTPTQIGVEQPAGTPLADGASTVAYGSVSIGSTLTKTFTIRNNGSTTLSITGVTVDGVNAANFSVTSAPASSIAAGATTTMDVRFDATSGGAKTAALHIACSDPAVGTAFDIELTGTGLVPPPTISNITINPISPSSTDSPFVTAQVTPGAGGSVSSVQLSFDTGGQTTSTVLNETMTSTETATGGWDGSGGAVPWTVQTSNGQGNIQQKLTANHTAAGQGGTCGVQLSKGDSAAANSITTTNAIDIGTATSAAIELWTSVSNINATGLGWSLQLATDASGTNWTTVLSELNVANHGFTKFHYDLTAGERVSTLRLRFNFFGNGTGGGTGPKVLLDDITLVATTGNPPTTITMYDDGLHGDGAAGDGVYGATIPAQADGETVNFTIAATGSGGAGTTTSSTTSYTVAPAPTITTTSPLPAGNTIAPYSQTFAAAGGSGTGYVWSLYSGSLPAGLTLSSAGVLSGTATAAGSYTFTVEVTDSANRSATQVFTLAISAQTQPNVLIILTDDQGWGDIGYHTPAGQIPIQTPRMDGFLNSGIRLENFYATTVCSVTRATLMTGRNQLRTGVNNTHGLALSEHIMPQTFKAAGYQTYMCGKWHIGGSDKNLGYTTVNGQNVRVIQEGLEYAPFNRGWDLHYGQYSGAIQYSTHHSNEELNPDLPDWWLNGVQQDGPSEHTDSQGHGGYSTDLLADKAVSCIQNRDPSKPMLLWLAFNAIHGPVSVPAEYLDKYTAIADTKRRTIAAAVDCMDAAIGRVLDQLTASGIADNTIVVFMSDNGGQESGGSLNDPLRGTKGDSWDGGVHLPAAISWPGVLATNVVSKQYVWVGDIFPTLCAATGVTAQNTEPFDGLNLWPALLSINSGNPDGPARPLDKPLVTISAAPIALNRFTDPVNGGEKVFKLIRNKVGQSVVNELYNMTDDVDPATGAPIESTDLLLGPNAAAYSAIVTSLTTAITDITPINYPPYIGPPLITNTVSEGGNITLYAPFSSWPKTAPTVQWRKNGVNIPGGTFAQVMDIDSVVVAGGYAAKLDLTDVTAADAGSYDVVITNAGGTTTSAAGTLTVTPASGSTTITNVATAPTAPTYLDPVWVLAQVQAAPGATISQVQLSYDLGVPVSTRVFQENFAITGTNTWNGTGAMNAWTTTAATANHVRQTTGTANHSIPVLLSNCSTTVGSSNVTCDSTSGLWPGMIITGVNVPTGATVSSVASGTSFVISAAATGSGTALSLTAGGVTLTNCTTTAASTTVTCDSTAGLTPGMSLSGTGLANNASVSSITDATTFVMNTAPTTPGSGLTISVAGAGAEFQTGTASLTDAMFATTNAINASGASGYIEFYAQTRDLAAANNCGWTFQVSSDGGATWNTRIAEDWNSSSVPLANCVLNAAGSVGGSTTVTCADTSALTTGRSVVGPTAYVTGGLTNGQPTVTTTSTAALAVGMFLQGSTGIPNNTRILTIDSATQFTMTANATATNAAVAIAGTYFAGNATVASITNGTTFVLNSPAYVNTGAAPIAASATTLNHGFQLYHYDLAGAELGSGLKLRWQFAGYSPTQPTRAPRVDVDDIIVATTSTPPPVALTMHDDGLHGDGAANDGWWGAAIPAQSGGTTVNFHVTATDSKGQSATSPVSSSYTYSVNASLTDATVKGAEFLGMPKDTSMTLNMVFAVDQEMFVEYGTTPGSYPFATTTALYSIDGAKPEFFNPAEITIQGLQPDTEYYYRVRHRAPGAPYFTARGERSFHTARPRGTTFTFTVTADPHIDVNTDMQLFWRAMQNISLDAPDIHLDIGDIFMTDKLADGLLGVPPRYKGGQPLSQATLNERAVFFRNQFERACHSIPFFFTLGNHEAEYGYLFNAAGDKQNNIPAWDLKSRKAFYPTPVPDAFYTGNPTPKDYTGGTLGLLEDYYAFEWGEALFIVLDPFWNVSTNPNQADDAWEWTLGKAQYDWLRDTLRNSSARYKFIFMHHIVGGSTQQANGTPQFAARGGIEVSDKFEWGGKNADGSPGFATKRPGWDMPIHELLVLHRVNVVFHGHDHLYGYQTKDGVVYLECPQPGTPNYGSFGSAADGQYVNLGANSSSYLLPNSGHIRVTVGPDQAVADYVRSYRTATDPMPPDATSVFNDENASRHNRDISHSFVLAPKISPPIEVANVGPGQVGLRWNAVPNKPYEIQWTTDLKTWTTIDTLTFTNTHTNATYTDTLPARVNGQRAFYRVRYTP